MPHPAAAVLEFQEYMRRWIKKHTFKVILLQVPALVLLDVDLAISQVEQ